MNKLTTLLLTLLLLSITTPAFAAFENVVWTNAVGVSVSGNSITKTAANGYGNAGAFSVQSFAGDGACKGSLTQTSKTRKLAFGISSTDVNQSNTSIGYRMQNAGSGGRNLLIYDGATLLLNQASALFGSESFEIRRVGTVITYYVNGVLKATASTPSTGPMFCDAAIDKNGTTLSNATIDPGADTTPPTWAAPAGAVSASSVGPFTADINLGSGARSSDTATVRAYLVNGPGPVNRSTAIVQDFTVNPVTVTPITLAGLAAGSQYTVQVTNLDAAGNEEVTNTLGEVTFTTTNDFAITVRNVHWTAGIGVTITGPEYPGDTLTKTLADGNNAGAFEHAQQGFALDGYCEYEIPSSTDVVQLGLSLVDNGLVPTSHLFSLGVVSAGLLSITESGTAVGPSPALSVGDKLRVRRVGGVISYFVNGSLVYVSTGTVSGTLHCDAALFTSGAVILNARIADISDDIVAPVFQGVGNQSDLVVTQDAEAVTTATWTGADDAAGSDPVSYEICWTLAPGQPSHNDSDPECTPLVDEATVCTANACSQTIQNIHPGSINFAVIARDAFGNRTAYDNTDTATLTIVQEVGPTDMLLKNGAVFGAAPLVGSGGAVTLDGVDDYVQMAANFMMGRVNNFTLVATIKPSGNLDLIVENELIGNKDGAATSTGDGITLAINGSGSNCATANTNVLYVRNYRSTGNSVSCIGPVNEVVTGVAQQVALSVDAANSGFACLGQNCGTPATVSLPAGTNQWKFGNRGDGFAPFFGMDVDNIQFYDHALTVAEIQALDSGGVQCDTSAEVCAHLDETSGVIARDIPRHVRIYENGDEGELLTGTWAEVAGGSGGDALESSTAGSTYSRDVYGNQIFWVTDRAPATAKLTVDAMSQVITPDAGYIIGGTSSAVPFLVWRTDGPCGWHTITVEVQGNKPVNVDAIATTCNEGPAPKMAARQTCFGDSVTAAFGLTGADSYCNLLAVDDGLINTNRAANGKGVTVALQSMYQNLFDDAPQRVIVTLPLNNSNAGAVQYLDELRLDFRSMMAWVTGVAPNAEVIFGANTFTTAGTPDRIDQMIRDAALEFPQIKIAYTKKPFEGAPGLLQADGLHPTVEGQIALKGAMNNAKQQRFK